MDDNSLRKLAGGFLQYTILRDSTRLVNIMNITSYEAHNPIVWQKTLVLSCGSDDGRIERKNDFHNFWMIVYPTYSVNGNPFHKLLFLEVWFQMSLLQAQFLVLKRC